jgi:hypothetical protein
MGLTELIGGAWALDPAAFRDLVATDPSRLRLGLFVAFLAGLSLAVGQSVALFAVGVAPRRFVVSLLLQAALFVTSFLVWSTSVWWLGGVAFDAARPWRDVVAAPGLAHAPQLFGALVLAPYFGAALHVGLSIWTLLATLVATATLLDLGFAEAAVCAGGGWLLAQLLQRTVGRPFTALARSVRRHVAGAPRGESASAR